MTVQISLDDLKNVKPVPVDYKRKPGREGKQEPTKRIMFELPEPAYTKLKDAAYIKRTSMKALVLMLIESADWPTRDDETAK